MNETTIDLSAIEIGTQVAWLTWDHPYGAEAYVGTVSRFTPTQIVVSLPRPGRPNEVERFRRKDGRGIGGPLWGVYLRSPNDPQVVRARAASRFRGAMRDIETLARAIDPKNPVHARTQLGRIRELAEHALVDLAYLPKEK